MLPPLEIEFCFQMTQDLLDIGSRAHGRRLATCQFKIYDPRGEVMTCLEYEDRMHVFITCPHSRNKANFIKETLENLLLINISWEQILHFGFTHRNQRKVRAALFLVAKSFYIIYNNREGSYQEFLEMLKECFREESRSGRRIAREVEFQMLLLDMNF